MSAPTPPYLAENLPDVLPQFLLARINGDAFYQNIFALIVDPGDTENDILKKLASKMGKNGVYGIAVLILPVETALDTAENDATGPLKFDIAFQVWEDRQINESTQGSNIRAYTVARHTFALFKKFAVQGVCNLLVPQSPVISLVPPPANQKKLRGFEIGFTAREDDQFVIPKLNRLTLTFAGDAVTITSPDPAANIYYTLDGSAPDPTKTLYTHPINLVNPTTIFCQAVNPGGYLVAGATDAFLNGIYTPVSGTQWSNLAGGNLVWTGAVWTLQGAPGHIYWGGAGTSASPYAGSYTTPGLGAGAAPLVSLLAPSYPSNISCGTFIPT